MLAEPGARLGPYEILSALGAGAWARSIARDTDRTVAINILRTTHAEIGPRFAREAKAIAALSHPHICTLFNIGHDDGTGESRGMVSFWSHYFRFKTQNGLSRSIY